MWLKNRIFSGLGNSLEWFDFALYGFFGPIFSTIFFSSAAQFKWVSLIITYAIFAVGFAARPIGALIFGYLGDKYGRVIPLRFTPILITLTTIAISLLPTYKTMGNTAIFLLLITRVVQGILLGGEFAGNIVYLCESSTSWKYFWGSIGSSTGSFGIILASTTASIFYNIFSHEFMYSYGWRIAFMLSVPLGIISFFMRLKMSESPEFYRDPTNANPLITSIKHYKKTLFYSLTLIYLHSTSFYFVFMFLPVFLTKSRELPESAAMLNNTGFLVLHLCLIPLFGAIVNVIGGLKSLVIIGITFVLLSIPLFYCIAYGTVDQLFIGLSIFSIGTAFNAAIIPGLLAEMIPSKVRYTILALAFNVGFGIFGGLMPFLGLLLIHKTGSILSPSIYLTFASLITLISGALLLKSEEKHEVREIPSS